ncbi:MAG: hypothetical protein MUW56_08065 [Chryseobacterium sp.]|uniref:hypothetical protein n=1 Tax=Chryseobacterium sp. TaxID=1871047 RepID=UPI0025C4D4B3|nr:hypothetical protein [Chryseobacterium sp.]MCJ7933581.1 hypothetical protein [Chryseobacterium sp.]
MEFIKKSYYYFFYKIYRSIEYTSELSGGSFLTSFKAGFVMIVLEIWVLMSLGAYYATYTKTAVELSISMPIIYIPLLIIIGFNYFTLDYKDTWKGYNAEFDRLPKNKNRLGSWIVFGIVLLIISNLVYSFYLMSQIDWSQYR